MTTANWQIGTECAHLHRSDCVTNTCDAKEEVETEYSAPDNFIGGLKKSSVINEDGKEEKRSLYGDVQQRQGGGGDKRVPLSAGSEDCYGTGFISVMPGSFRFGSCDGVA